MLDRSFSTQLIRTLLCQVIQTSWIQRLRLCDDALCVQCQPAGHVLPSEWIRIRRQRCWVSGSGSGASGCCRHPCLLRRSPSTALVFSQLLSLAIGSPPWLCRVMGAAEDERPDPAHLQPVRPSAAQNPEVLCRGQNMTTRPPEVAAVGTTRVNQLRH